ncbi:MAG: hypothetical protein VYC39_20220 [Myxococcota bacterium]|nr:hypothetical protein [Myxococcota bacterium]
MSLRKVTAVCLLTFAASCAAYPTKDPTGQRFPTVSGKALSGERFEMPSAFGKNETLLLVGYKQRAQFDIDRWLIGLSAKELEVNVYEVPAVVGLVPSLIATRIDNGMKRGIPEEDWAQVITVYEDADRIAEFTGNEDELTGRVLLLDKRGIVKFFHDKGFSVKALERLATTVRQLKANTVALRGQ